MSVIDPKEYEGVCQLCGHAIVSEETRREYGRRESGVPLYAHTTCYPDPKLAPTIEGWVTNPDPGCLKGPGGRKGDWMTTFSGVQFWPLDPRREEIRLEDIAHSLSQQCRFAGHTRDIDNVVKGVLDALTGTLWEDDTQVWHVTATKNVYATAPQLHVKVMHFEAGDKRETFNALEELLEAIRWMSGADDFQEGGKARVGFEKAIRPLLERYRRV